MKDALEVIVGLKEKSYLSEYSKKIVPTLKDDKTKLNFERWVTLLNIVIDYGKKYYNGNNTDEILLVLRKIDNGFLTNPILKGFYEIGENKELIEQEIDKIYKENIKMDIIEDTSVSKEESKTYVKATSHKTGTETGFASPFLLAVLTATIEISTIAYIIFNAMD